MQKGGLRHFEDLQVRIPHAEGIEIGRTVRAAALNLFGWECESADYPHIRPMGSFLRGKPATTVGTPPTFNLGMRASRFSELDGQEYSVLRCEVHRKC